MMVLSLSVLVLGFVFGTWASPYEDQYTGGKNKLQEKLQAVLPMRSGRQNRNDSRAKGPVAQRLEQATHN